LIVQFKILAQNEPLNRRQIEMPTSIKTIPAPLVQTPPKRILIVDDEPTIVLTLSYALRSSGVEVITASRLEPAEEALSRYSFDLVIVDIRMSGILGIEGLELLSYIKRYWPKTEVIVMTAHGSSDIKEEAYGRGASYYYEKPVDITQLAERVRSMGIPVKG
jgi:DNA-binding NtrC family response regulator